MKTNRRAFLALLPFAGAMGPTAKIASRPMTATAAKVIGGGTISSQQVEAIYRGLRMNEEEERECIRNWWIAVSGESAPFL